MITTVAYRGTAVRNFVVSLRAIACRCAASVFISTSRSAFSSRVIRFSPSQRYAGSEPYIRIAVCYCNLRQLVTCRDAAMWGCLFVRLTTFHQLYKLCKYEVQCGHTLYFSLCVTV
jgi:hypothetical protein